MFKVGICGFGRIGRLVLRATLERGRVSKFPQLGTTTGRGPIVDIHRNCSCMSKPPFQASEKKATAIDVNVQEFEEVAKLDGFVDRTMLIEELLQGKKHLEKYVQIFAPSKFGKSLNLDMIHLFCDIADKTTTTKEDVAKDPTMEDLRSNPSKNMKVFLRQFEDKQFEECLILKREQFVIQHFGRHPVVFLDFKDCSPKNESGAIFFCAQQVRNGYLENDYLENSQELHRHLKRTCTDWINYSVVDLESLSVMRVMDGLKNLIKSLRMHWGRKPVFLVDEVDKPCLAAMENEVSDKQVRAIGTAITNVICSIVKTRDQQLKPQAALVTGICKFQNAGLSPMDNTLPVYFLSDDRFSKYYGLTAQEVKTLVEKLCGSDAEKTNKIISDINARYNGYYQRSSSGEHKEYARYCLFSVLNYMENTNTEKICFWSDGGFLTGKLVPVLRKSVEVMDDIQKLLYDDSGTIEIQYQEAVDVQHILGLYGGKEEPNKDAIFNLFLQRGYLAHNLEKPIKTVDGIMKINVKIPNLEIKAHYKKLFELYYKSLDKNLQSKLSDCGQIFRSLPTLDSTDFEKNLNNLCENFKYIFENFQVANERTICGYILSMLRFWVEYKKGGIEYAVKYLDDKGRKKNVFIDVWVQDDNFGIMFEVKFNSYAIAGRDEIGSKEKSSLAAAEDIVYLLPGKKIPESGKKKEEGESGDKAGKKEEEGGSGDKADKKKEEGGSGDKADKKKEEGASGGKAGTGRNLDILKNSGVKNYVLIGLAVDRDYNTHMLVFRDTFDWKNVIKINPEKHVADVLSTHLKLEKPVV